ncbi:glycosyltransferase [Verminephrobacter eiseniae]|uniref:glycosyltransferase family 2 protein n=1 Tax=Verminephrobacter eiseniae TaxID=364317 RepID=UPI002238EEFE|nr:glycosyltransferase family 2 protein [Verminephrobacter eiseniae]MCW5261685.1 glycosyltransferase [Verminephrobacter eiseniae]
MLSLLIPVYRNETGLPDLLAAVQSLHARLEGAMETVFVVDGSPDRCYEILRERLPHCALRARLVLLSRNFGSFAAIRVALQRASGAYFAVLAADLQEPPELVLRMHAALLRADCDVVIGVRQTRHEPLTTRLPAQIFWWLYRRYVLSEIPPGGVDVFACNRAFRDSLLQLQERHSSLIAQMFWLGFRRQQLSYVRQPRQHGVSAWTLRKKLGYMADSIFSFTDLPIRWLLRAGLGGTLAATAVGAAVLAAKLLGAITVPGYAMIMLTIVFFGALNLLSLGVVGSYAWRAYENTKARPLAVVLRDEQFGPPGVSNPGEQPHA